MSEQIASQDPSKLLAEVEFWKQRSAEVRRRLGEVAVFDRSFVLAHATMQQRTRYHELARILMADEFERRRVLAETYLNEKSLDPQTREFVVPQSDGLASIDLSDNVLVQAAIAEARAFHAAAVDAGRMFPGKDSLEFVGSASKDFSEQSALYALASSPLIVAPVARYFGVFPILTGFGVTLARNESFHRKSSQRLHFDPEDRSQLKVFVYLTDVDAKSGPFMAAPAHNSRHLFEQPDFLLDRKDDDVVEPGSIREFHGKAGTTIFCDTCRCLHAGARPGNRIRLVLSIEFNLPSHLGRKLFAGDPLPGRVRTSAIKLKNPDKFEAALLDAANGAVMPPTDAGLKQPGR